jgi:hypothetical protein
MSKANETKFKPSEKIIAIQSEICGLKKDSNNPFFKSKYISVGHIVNALKPVLHENDCYSTHRMCISPEGKPLLESEICYKDGTVLLGSVSPLPVKDSSDPQKLGSAITYMRRYNLTAMLEIEEDDDDGNNANQPTPQTRQNQFQKLGNAASGDQQQVTYAKLLEMLNQCQSEEEVTDFYEKNKWSFNGLKKQDKDAWDDLIYQCGKKKKEFDIDE